MNAGRTVDGANGPGGLDRRRFFALGGIAGLGILGVAACGPLVEAKGSVSGRTGKALVSKAPLPEPFRVELPRPEVLRPAAREGGRDVYEITQRAADVEILPGLRTNVWGFNGTFPGPTIEARRGEPIVVRMRNELPVPTSTHLHGGVVAPESDGYPTDLIVPRGYTKRVDAAMLAMHAELDKESGHQHAAPPAGAPDPKIWSLHPEVKDYEYGLDQRAALLWYHDHRMDFSAPQVWRGLAGAFVVRDEEEAGLGLPSGEKELTLVVCDRAFEADGSLMYPSVDKTLSERSGVDDAHMDGVLGDVLLVNGAPWPVAKVSNTRYRLRLLNASNARQYNLRLDPEPAGKGGSAGKGGVAPFVQIGSDAGLLAAPQELASVPMSPAERFDVIVDFSAYAVGTEVVLTNSIGSGGTAQVMKFVVDREEEETSRPLPQRLSPGFEALAPRQAVKTRLFDFRLGNDGLWTINGQVFDPEQSLASPELDTVELWRFTSDFNHPVHLHLAHFQVLSRDGRPPLPADAGWKDTVNVTPYGITEVLVKFTGFTGRYMLHCHNLEHEDMAMMANFRVV